MRKLSNKNSFSAFDSVMIGKEEMKLVEGGIGRFSSAQEVATALGTDLEGYRSLYEPLALHLGDDPSAIWGTKDLAAYHCLVYTFGKMFQRIGKVRA